MASSVGKRVCAASERLASASVRDWLPRDDGEVPGQPTPPLPAGRALDATCRPLPWQRPAPEEEREVVEASRRRNEARCRETPPDLGGREGPDGARAHRRW